MNGMKVVKKYKFLFIRKISIRYVMYKIVFLIFMLFGKNVNSYGENDFEKIDI